MLKKAIIFFFSQQNFLKIFPKLPLTFPFIIFFMWKPSYHSWKQISTKTIKRIALPPQSDDSFILIFFFFFCWNPSSIFVICNQRSFTRTSINVVYKIIGIGNIFGVITMADLRNFFRVIYKKLTIIQNLI